MHRRRWRGRKRLEKGSFLSRTSRILTSCRFQLHYFPTNCGFSGAIKAVIVCAMCVHNPIIFFCILIEVYFGVVKTHNTYKQNKEELEFLFCCSFIFSITPPFPFLLPNPPMYLSVFFLKVKIPFCHSLEYSQFN